MTDKEALKLALEALESCEMSNYGRDWVWPATAHETAMKNVKEALTAIREALAHAPEVREQPAQQHVEHCLWARNGHTPCPHVQPAPVAEPHEQQEPVAWRTKNAVPPGGYVLFQQYPKAVADLGGEIEPLYTYPPPSKPWVGLTDEERGQVYASWRFNGSNSSNLELCRAIEAKLRERNEHREKNA